MRVPAVHFVGAEAFCAGCFRGGDPVSSNTESVRAPRQAHRSVPQLRITEKQATQAHRRRERIRTVLAVPRGAKLPEGKEKSREGAPLCPREAEVVRLIAEGRCTKEIAAEMKISVRTVKFYLTEVFAKTGTHGQRGLLLWWLRARGAASRDPSRLQDCVARIEGELEILFSAVRDRSEKLEREIGAAASARDCVVQIERAFEVLKVSLANEASDEGWLHRLEAASE